MRKDVRLLEFIVYVHYGLTFAMSRGAHCLTGAVGSSAHMGWAFEPVEPQDLIMAPASAPAIIVSIQLPRNQLQASVRGMGIML